MSSVVYWAIGQEEAGQRIDNFLFSKLKGLPKSRIYRALRQGEVRVNKKRIKANYRLQLEDQVRIPPLRCRPQQQIVVPSEALQQRLAARIILEDQDLIVIDKPSGLAVHGGTGVALGVIEILRAMRPECRFLELVHRLDRETSGCLLLAKKRQVLLDLHRCLAEKNIEKQYLALVKGCWKGGRREISAPLLKNRLSGGERMVQVHQDGKAATTIFYPIRRFAQATLVMVRPVSGRTHQIRVHAAHLGHPIAGDVKYGDNVFNRNMKSCGLKRLFLHACALSCELPEIKRNIAICVKLNKELQDVLKCLHE